MKLRYDVDGNQIKIGDEVTIVDKMQGNKFWIGFKGVVVDVRDLTEEQMERGLKSNVLLHPSSDRPDTDGREEFWWNSRALRISSVTDAEVDEAIVSILRSAGA